MEARTSDRGMHDPGEPPQPVQALCEVSDLGLSDRECLISEPLDPCTLVIFGASGDLAERKLIPALFNLHRLGGLPDPVRIVGCARTRMDDAAFRERLRASLAPEDGAEWERFASLVHYRPVDYTDAKSFEDLSNYLRDLDARSKMPGNRIFYLAIPPALYETVAGLIGRVGLAEEGAHGKRWVRMVVEKPFGRDLSTAMALDRSLQESFREHQIFRIDHYLAKETVQNVLILRFANAIFEPVWNRRYIDHVDIMAAETLGVEHRAGYYEEAGVLRDMFQNHMMQLLALTAMEPPPRFETDLVMDEKTKVFRSLRPFPIQKLTDYLILGQYGRGTIDGKVVPGYREEPGVDPVSLTPTYASMRVHIDNWRWQGVPFNLTSGKRMARKATEVDIHFREVPHSIFRNILGEKIEANRLTLGVHPEEKISMVFQTKNPGATLRLRAVAMDFLYSQNYGGPVLDAYEKVLIDCIRGDRMLFWRQDGVELSWAFLSPILEGCEECDVRGRMLHPYVAGTMGPERE
ncbi:MAG: glucose-6-phosphate dehydrogenase [Syntrophobacteraceae bacterium]